MREEEERKGEERWRRRRRGGGEIQGQGKEGKGREKKGRRGRRIGEGGEGNEGGRGKVEGMERSHCSTYMKMCELTLDNKQGHTLSDLPCCRSVH